jgi:mRNA interferase HicA
MNSDQFRRWLAKQGCEFEPAKGGHLRVILGDRVTYIPQHGGAKQLKTGLMRSVMKDLGLENR